MDYETIKTYETLDKYCMERGYKLAALINDAFGIVVKPKPKWCPLWLYRKIIKDSIKYIEVIK